MVTPEVALKPTIAEDRTRAFGSLDRKSVV